MTKRLLDDDDYARAAAWRRRNPDVSQCDFDVFSEIIGDYLCAFDPSWLTVENGRIATVFLSCYPVPSSIGSCSQLQELDLNGIRYKGGLPSSLRKCSHLTKLKVFDVALDAFPQWLGELSALKTFSIYFNRVDIIDDVPESLNLLTELEELNLFMARIHGKFGPLDMFYRICREGGKVNVGGNNFHCVDFKGDQFTEGLIREHNGSSSLCIASFPGVEFLEWQRLLLQAESLPDCSQLCVFLEKYASAKHEGACPPDWHAGGYEGAEECKRFAHYFELAGSKAVEGHRRFGCQWFRKWHSNVMKALERGHREFVVVTKADHQLGISQTVEFFTLKELQKDGKVADMKIYFCWMMKFQEVQRGEGIYLGENVHLSIR